MIVEYRHSNLQPEMSRRDNDLFTRIRACRNFYVALCLLRSLRVQLVPYRALRVIVPALRILFREILSALSLSLFLSPLSSFPPTFLLRWSHVPSVRTSLLLYPMYISSSSVLFGGNYGAVTQNQIEEMCEASLMFTRAQARCSAREQTFISRARVELGV